MKNTLSRDQVAAMLLQGILAGDGAGTDKDVKVDYAVDMADRLIKRLAETAIENSEPVPLKSVIEGNSDNSTDSLARSLLDFSNHLDFLKKDFNERVLSHGNRLKKHPAGGVFSMSETPTDKYKSAFAWIMKLPDPFRSDGIKYLTYHDETKKEYSSLIGAIDHIAWDSTEQGYDSWKQLAFILRCKQRSVVALSCRTWFNRLPEPFKSDGLKMMEIALHFLMDARQNKFYSLRDAISFAFIATETKIGIGDWLNLCCLIED